MFPGGVTVNFSTWRDGERRGFYLFVASVRVSLLGFPWAKFVLACFFMIFFHFMQFKDFKKKNLPKKSKLVHVNLIQQDVSKQYDQVTLCVCCQT